MCDVEFREGDFCNEFFVMSSSQITLYIARKHFMDQVSLSQ